MAFRRILIIILIATQIMAELNNTNTTEEQNFSVNYDATTISTLSPEISTNENIYNETMEPTITTNDNNYNSTSNLTLSTVDHSTTENNMENTTPSQNTTDIYPSETENGSSVGNFEMSTESQSIESTEKAMTFNTTQLNIVNQTTDSDKQTTDSDNQTTDSDNQTTDSDNQTTDSENQTTDSDNQTTESYDQTSLPTSDGFMKNMSTTVQGLQNTTEEINTLEYSTEATAFTGFTTELPNVTSSTPTSNSVDELETTDSYFENTTMYSETSTSTSLKDSMSTSDNGNNDESSVTTSSDTSVGTMATNNNSDTNTFTDSLLHTSEDISTEFTQNIQDYTQGATLESRDFEAELELKDDRIDELKSDLEIRTIILSVIAAVGVALLLGLIFYLIVKKCRKVPRADVVCHDEDLTNSRESKATHFRPQTMYDMSEKTTTGKERPGLMTFGSTSDSYIDFSEEPTPSLDSSPIYSNATEIHNNNASQLNGGYTQVELNSVNADNYYNNV